jgi:hypothetical protein
VLTECTFGPVDSRRRRHRGTPPGSLASQPPSSTARHTDTYARPLARLTVLVLESNGCGDKEYGCGVRE